MDEDGEKKSDETPAVMRGKYTELELRTRGIGKFHATQTPGWRTKLSTYHDEEVKRAFLAIKASLRLLCTDVEGYHYIEIAHQVAQIIIDKFLLQRCKGDKVPIPGPVVSASSLQPASKAPAKKGVLKATAVKADFTKWDGKIDTIADINWIYNHLMVADVTAEDAPSPGAWAHLQYHRSNTAAMAEFFTKVYPRLIPAKGTIQKIQDKFHDDGRTTFDLLDRLLAEDAAGEGEVPVLQMVLPERPGLQNQAGQSAVSQEDS
ncbi:unnamed protein product [marine sediment metagenome]|uniref:Uncharacterized protein n=1 Tax=marine sediment metagenome TaxID=412755 RepID=X1L3X0_9ZZZZ